MNGSQKIGELVGLIAEIQRRRDAIQLQQAAIMQEMQDALRRWDREDAQQLFSLYLRWNELHELAAQWCDSLARPQLNTYVVDGWFLEDLIHHLTPGPDEEIAHVTGARVGAVRMLSRICQLTTESKTMVYARGTARSCADTEIEILEHGNLLHAMAHSHPGGGADATHPSSIDINYLGTIQRVGSEAIGIIVTRDGWVRFFTVTKPFRVFVMGAGVTQTEEYVFHVTLSDQDRHPKAGLPR
jgi:hypothetical protein